MTNYPSNKDIDEYIKILKRFLKYKRKYTFIMKYLFGFGRDKNQFYDDVRRLYNGCYDFRDILHIQYTLGPADIKMGFTFWHDNIKPLSDEFKIYFAKSKPFINKN